MPLTRPTVENINTTITELTDPVSVLNKGGVSARQDVGFLINRDGGGTANVAIYWDETNDRFNLVNTTSSGATNSNVAISSYANLNIHTLDALGSVDTAKVNITNTSLDDSIRITTTEDSSTAGPVVSLKRNSASPADADYLGQLKFIGENDADQSIVYAKMTAKILDASDGTEDGILEFAFMKAGSQNISARFRSDSLQLINGTTLTVNGLISTDSTITAGGLINTAGNVSGAVVNAGALNATGTTTLAATNVSGFLNSSANVSAAVVNAGTLTTTGLLTSGNILASGNVTAPYYVGNGSFLTGVAAGASAGGAIYENTDDITDNYTLTTGSNGMSVGPITIAATKTVTVPSGQRWVIL